MREKLKKWLSSISTTIFLLIIIAIIIFGVVLFVDAGIEEAAAKEAAHVLRENVMTIAVSIICSILASVIYANIFDSKSNEEKKLFKSEIKEDIKKDIEETIEKAYDKKSNDGIKKVIGGVADLYHNTIDMSPSRYFTSSNTPNEEFNAYWDRKISESRKFIYFGASARYACYRLYKLKHQTMKTANFNIEIFIVNPANKEIFKENENFIMAKEKNRDYASKRKMEAIIKEEKENILSCLSALEEMKYDFNNIDVYMIQHLPFINIEMTGDTLALEFFRTNDNYEKYPLTLIYEGKKTLYEGYEFYLQREREKADHIKKNELKQEYIIKLGEDAGLGLLDEEQLKEFRDKRIYYV